MKNLFLIACLFVVLSCQQSRETKNVDSNLEEDLASHHIPAITSVFDAHGGFDNWTQLKSMSYEMGESKTLVDLQSRYTRIDSEDQSIGFDGQNIWVYPATENADRQRMRYNLMFYFYAFPFVVGDLGVNYEVIEPVALKGKTYDAIKITYDNGVGDSPNDNYIICADQDTHQMEWLMYTATFGGEESDRYSLIKYEGWRERGGVILPSSLQWYQFANSEVGEPRGPARSFQNVQVSQDHPNMRNFEVPEGATLAQMPENN